MAYNINVIDVDAGTHTHTLTHTHSHTRTHTLTHTLTHSLTHTHTHSHTHTYSHTDVIAIVIINIFAFSHLGLSFLINMFFLRGEPLAKFFRNVYFGFLFPMRSLAGAKRSSFSRYLHFEI